MNKLFVKREVQILSQDLFYLAMGPLGIGTVSLQAKADHHRWAICSVSSVMALVQFLPLEPEPLGEVNNMSKAPEMLCSLAERWCFMKCHPVKPSAENHICPSLWTFPGFWFHSLKISLICLMWHTMVTLFFGGAGFLIIYWYIKVIDRYTRDELLTHDIKCYFING